MLMSMSRIRFRNYLNDSDEARLPDRFIEEFETGLLLDRCNKFCFTSPENWIEYDDMLAFIEQFGGKMKELTIFATYIRNALYDLSNNDLIKLIPSQLTKLEAVSDRVRTKLIVSNDRLKNIETLRLGSCILKLIDGAVCAPVELRMKNVFFLRNRKDFQETVKLNDLFDFRNLKELQIDCTETGNVELDLSIGVLNLESLVLNRVTILNMESSTWTVRKLSLCRKTKITKTGMKYEEIEFDGPNLDVAVLPTTLKSLTMRLLRAKLLNIEEAQNLVQLKYLSLHRKRFSILSSFQNCANLTHLHLYPMDEGDFELVTVDVNLFPKTLKVLRLSHNCELTGKIDFEIETIMIEHIPFDDAIDFFVENLNAKNALLYCTDFVFDTDDEAAIDKVLRELSFRCFIAGPFFQSDKERYAFSYYPYLEQEDAKAMFSIKADQDAAVIKKEVSKAEFDRLKNAWWTKDHISF
ncbi:hypothetical protein Bhyg_12836 [Pseudolycoriella hygida]|uniref:Uncharacterized protein n=1 Tax=Pseudolycoriella hygida TaxID=35572 RepID=A0A9Q0MY56_9DIPT|nr:hypothetical protein Bhyg_12836 [Pseudolycoriella hygida]